MKLFGIMYQPEITLRILAAMDQWWKCNKPQAVVDWPREAG
jgi:hypothetical protein